MEGEGENVRAQIGRPKESRKNCSRRPFFPPPPLIQSVGAFGHSFLPESPFSTIFSLFSICFGCVVLPFYRDKSLPMPTSGGNAAALFASSAILPLSPAQIVALTLALIGLILGFSAILTPSWQAVYAREIEQWIQSGLWLNCQTRPNGMHTCVYSFSNADLNFYTQPELLNMRSPSFYVWQRPLLFALLSAQLLAFLALLSLCLSFHPPTRRFSALAFIGCMAMAVLLHSGSAVAFAILSQMVEYRFFHVSVSGIYEKHRGYSFYLELAAIALLIASLLPAAFHLIRVLQQQDQKQRQYVSRTPPPPPMTMGQFGGGQDEHFWDEERFAMRQLPPLPPMAYR